MANTSISKKEPGSKAGQCVEGDGTYARHLLVLHNHRQLETAAFQVHSVLTMIEHAVYGWRHQTGVHPADADFLRDIEETANTTIRRVDDILSHVEAAQDHMRPDLPFFTDAMLDEEIRRIRSKRGGPEA